jgi:nucleoside phosphorylase
VDHPAVLSLYQAWSAPGPDSRLAADRPAVRVGDERRGAERRADDYPGRPEVGRKVARRREPEHFELSTGPGGPVSTVDVLIITALQEEYEAARAAVTGVGEGNWKDHGTDSTTPYLIGEYGTPDGGTLTAALARPTDMGGRLTAPLVTTLTDLLQPGCLAMCGVCAGNPDDTAHGDVIVASPAYEWDEGKLSGSTLEGSHRQYPLNDRWLRAVQDFDVTTMPSYGVADEHEAAIWLLERLYKGQDARTHPARSRYFPKGTWSTRLDRLESDGLVSWQDSAWVLTPAGSAQIVKYLANDVDGPGRLPFAARPGPMASGSAVIKDPEIWTRLKRMGVRNILGLDMEAATIATVAHQREVPQWLVAKGVMDNASFDKDDRFKEFAARASAEVLYALLRSLVSTRTRSPRRSPEPVAAAATIPGAVKVEVLRELHFDWQDLADLVGVPPFQRARFAQGHEPRGVWEWLEARSRLAELPAALDLVGRADLGDRLRSADPPSVDG